MLQTLYEGTFVSPLLASDLHLLFVYRASRSRLYLFNLHPRPVTADIWHYVRTGVLYLIHQLFSDSSGVHVTSRY